MSPMQFEQAMQMQPLPGYMPLQDLVRAASRPIT